MDELSKSLEFTCSQLDKELGRVKKGIAKVQHNTYIEKDLLGPVEVPAKLVERDNRS